MRWTDATVVVTGGSGGIGFAVARAAIDRGARVGLAARGSGGLERAAAALGPSVATARVDVADRSSVDRAIAALADRLGPVDVLVNGAGVGALGPVVSTTTQVTDHLLAVNFG